MSFFSIIIPAYNVEEYIRQCLDSIISQTFQDFEVLLVDDASIDNTYRIAQEYSSKYNFIKVRTIDRVPVGTVRNEAISMATGEYLLFIDADDYIENQMLESIYETVIDNKPDICFLPNHFIDYDYGKCEHDFIIADENKFYYWTNREDFFQYIYRVNGVIPTAMWSIACKRELISTNNICMNSEYIWSQDSDFIFQVLHASETVSISFFRGYVWNRKNISSATRNVTSKKLISRLVVYKKWYDALDDYCFGVMSSSIKDYLKCWLHSCYCQELLTYTFVKDKKDRAEIAEKFMSDSLWNKDVRLIPSEYGRYGLYLGRVIFMIKHYIKRLFAKA